VAPVNSQRAIKPVETQRVLSPSGASPPSAVAVTFGLRRSLQNLHGLRRTPSFLPISGCMMTRNEEYPMLRGNRPFCSCLGTTNSIFVGRLVPFTRPGTFHRHRFSEPGAAVRKSPRLLLIHPCPNTPAFG
jgi:hypothetical protein